MKNFVWNECSSHFLDSWEEGMRKINNYTKGKKKKKKKKKRNNPFSS